MCSRIVQEWHFISGHTPMNTHTVFACVHACMCTYVHAYLHVWSSTCRGQRLNVGVFLNYSSPHVLRPGSLTWTQSLPIWVVSLVSLLWGSPVSSSRALGLHVGHHTWPESHTQFWTLLCSVVYFKDEYLPRMPIGTEVTILPSLYKRGNEGQFYKTSGHQSTVGLEPLAKLIWSHFCTVFCGSKEDETDYDLFFFVFFFNGWYSCKQDPKIWPSVGSSHWFS